MKHLRIVDKNTPDSFHQDLEIDTLARTLWGEARGEGAKGMEAVACVILNRVDVAKEKGRYWWGNNITQICQKPYQFSCWNRSDPNFKKLISVGHEEPGFATGFRIAERACQHKIVDITNGATHYHSKDVKPYWAKSETPVAHIGNHVFYRLVES